MQERRPRCNVLGYTLLGALGFMALVAYVYLQRVGLLYFLFVLPFAYLLTAVVLLTFVVESHRRLAVISLRFSARYESNGARCHTGSISPVTEKI